MYVNPNLNLGPSAQHPTMPRLHVDSTHLNGKVKVKTTIMVITGISFVVFCMNLIYIINRCVESRNVLLSIIMGVLSLICSLIFRDVVLTHPYDLQRRRNLKWGVLLLMVDNWMYGLIAISNSYNNTFTYIILSIF